MKNELTRGMKAKLSLEKIRSLLMTNRISYDNARFFSIEPLSILNEEMLIVRKKIGDRRKGKITFISYMR